MTTYTVLCQILMSRPDDDEANGEARHTLLKLDSYTVLNADVDKGDITTSVFLLCAAGARET